VPLPPGASQDELEEALREATTRRPLCHFALAFSSHIGMLHINENGARKNGIMAPPCTGDACELSGGNQEAAEAGVVGRGHVSLLSNLEFLRGNLLSFYILQQNVCIFDISNFDTGGERLGSA
jgi:hypothetical protein